MTIGLLVKLAWRNLWRHARRTALMITAVALGVWANVGVAAITRGWLEQQTERSLKNLLGHVQIHAPGFLDDPAIERSFPEPSGGLLTALQGPGVKAWDSRVRVPAVVQSERESAGVTLLGVDFRRERGLSFIGEAPLEGRPLAGPEDEGLLIGRKLAEILETRLGKRVVLMSQDARGSVADRGFRIVGVFRALPESLETTAVFTGRGAAQRLLRLGSGVTEVALTAPDRLLAGAEAARLAPEAGGLEVRPWSDIEPLLTLAERVTDNMLLVWYVIVFLLMSFGLVNTLLMAVYERTREIGLVQALGMPPAQILLQVLIESVFLILIGLAAGNALTWASLAWASRGLDLSAFAKGLELLGAGPILYPQSNLKDFAAANGVLFVLGLAASLYPAWRSARQVPVEAITRSP